jgi:hypothetical protein
VPILAHGLGSACAAHARIVPMRVPLMVTALTAGTMAGPTAARWWPKGEAVGGGRRRGPSYMRPARRAAVGLTVALGRRRGGRTRFRWGCLLAAMTSRWPAVSDHKPYKLRNDRG